MGYVPPPVPDFGQQMIGGWDPRPEPVGPYQRYLRDLYGDPRRNWLPLLDFTLIVLVGMLVAVIVWWLIAG